MSENPYQSPIAEMPAVGVKSGRHEDVRSVAVYQKGVLVCILLQIGLVVGQFALPPHLRFLTGLIAIPVLLTGFAFVVLLSLKVYHPAVGVLMGLLTCVPLLGFLVLLVVNQRATTILQSNGHKVGLLGASLSDFGGENPLP